jgi:hypothetical protein
MPVMLSSIFSLCTSHLTTWTWNWFGLPGSNTSRFLSNYLGLGNWVLTAVKGNDIELESAPVPVPVPEPVVRH